jgi:hypothetical protein
MGLGDGGRGLGDRGWGLGIGVQAQLRDYGRVGIYGERSGRIVNRALLQGR